MMTAMEAFQDLSEGNQKVEAGIGSWVDNIDDASLIHMDQVKAQIESLIDVGLINKDSDVHVVSLAIRPTLVTLTN